MNRFIFLALFISSNVLGHSVIILDLGGVVFKEPEFFVYDTLADDIKQQMPQEYKQRRIFLRAFEFVNLVAQKDLKMDWLFGRISGDEVARIIKENIDKPTFVSFFQSPYEQILIKHGADMMFNPKQLAHYSYPYPQAPAFIQKCQKNGIRILILSNWDPLSFKLLVSMHSAIFESIPAQDIFIPAFTGFAKPQPESYEYVLNKAGLKAEDCLFIDDSKNNVEAAKKCGIKGVFHTSWESTMDQMKDLL